MKSECVAYFLRAPVYPLMLLMLLPARNAVAANPRVEIRPEFSEILLGEGIRFRITIENTTDDRYAVIGFARLGSYGGALGALQVTIVDPAGKQLPSQSQGSTLGSRRTALGAAAEDLVEISRGQRLEGLTRGIDIRPEIPGRHLVRVIYRPKLKDGPEFVREFDLNVKNAEEITVDRKSVPSAGERDERQFTAEILKVRTADGYWLFARTKPAAAIARLVQVNEKATFSVSSRQETPGRATDEIRLTYSADGRENIVRVDYATGALIPEVTEGTRSN